MICTLCLKEITDNDMVNEDGKIRHRSCAEEFERMIVDLEQIYKDDDIYE